jgi:hypothetical protein
LLGVIISNPSLAIGDLAGLFGDLLALVDRDLNASIAGQMVGDLIAGAGYVTIGDVAGDFGGRALIYGCARLAGVITVILGPRGSVGAGAYARCRRRRRA